MTAVLQTDASLGKLKKKFMQLPYLTKVVFEDGTKKHMENLQQVLVTGMRKNNLGYAPLSAMTKHIRHAQNKDSKPISPLVGNKGMIENLEVVKDGRNSFALQPNNKYSVTKSPSWKSSRITWRRLWLIHEWGAVIPVTEKMRNAFVMWFKIGLRKATMQLVIPARRSMQRAYNRYIRSEIKSETNAAMIRKMKALMRSV